MKESTPGGGTRKKEGGKTVRVVYKAGKRGRGCTKHFRATPFVVLTPHGLVHEKSKRKGGESGYPLARTGSRRGRTQEGFKRPGRSTSISWYISRVGKRKTRRGGKILGGHVLRVPPGRRNSLPASLGGNDHSTAGKRKRRGSGGPQGRGACVRKQRVKVGSLCV